MPLMITFYSLNEGNLDLALDDVDFGPFPSIQFSARHLSAGEDLLARFTKDEYWEIVGDRPERGLMFSDVSITAKRALSPSIYITFYGPDQENRLPGDQRFGLFPYIHLFYGGMFVDDHKEVLALIDDQPWEIIGTDWPEHQGLRFSGFRITTLDSSTETE